MRGKLNVAIGLVLTTALISGTNNFLTKSAVKVVSDPVVFTFLKNVIVAGFLLGLVLLFTRFRELKGLSRKQWTQLIAIGIIGGSIPFILFFTGLQQTSALTASFIHKTLFIWVTIMAVPLLKERVTKITGLALVLLFGGNVALGFPSFTLSTGELMILGATLFWAVENIIAKSALKNLSSWTVAAARMTLGSAILLGVVAFQGNLSLLSDLSAAQWTWTLTTSILLLGYVLTWYTALKYAPATLVAALLVPATLVTNILTMVFTDGTMSGKQALSGVLLASAVTLLIINRKRILPKQIPQSLSENA